MPDTTDVPITPSTAALTVADLQWLADRISVLESWVQIPAQHIPVQVTAQPQGS